MNNNQALFQMEPDTGILHLFTSNGNIRATSVNGQMWLFASDLARHFGVRDALTLIRILPEDDNLYHTQKVRIVRSNGISDNKDMLVVSEAGLDMLCMRSNRPELKAFQYEVLKIIQHVRHTGMYIQPQIANAMAFDPQIAQETAQKYKEFCQAYFNTDFVNPIHGMMFREAFWQNTVKYQQARRIQEMQDQINGLQAKTDFVDALTNTNNTISLADLTKLIWNTDTDIGRNRLMEMMRNDGYLMKKGTFNTPTQASLNHGLMIEVMTITGIPVTRITPTGIGYFINIYRNNPDGVSQA